MSQRRRQQESGEISLLPSKRERQQENGNISDIENQFGGQDDGAHCINKSLDPIKDALPFMFKYRHIMFLLSCVIGVLCVDPLFLYLPVINQDNKCLTLDKRLMVTALCFRSIFDMIYVGNIILGYFSRRHGLNGLDPVDQQPRQIIKEYLRLDFAIDILAILPMPQVLVPIIFSKLTRSRFLDLRKLLNLFLLLQYVPRVLRIYLSWRKHIKSTEFAKRVWIKAAFNIFLYILASHVLGGLWYFFSIQRETACWHVACENHIGCIPSSFECGRSLGNYTFIDDACPIQTSKTMLVDFGIFLKAIQSGTVSSTNIPQKIMYCFWWGLQNLSSLGQNLETSTYLWENCFAVFISIYGLLLFLYFIGNAQTYMQMANEKATLSCSQVCTLLAEKVEKAKNLEDEWKMGLIITKLESWMATNQFPDNMKEPIITCIRHGLEENKDFDMEKPIFYISKDLVTKIRNHLCLPLLKTVPNLENHGENLAERICESLKPKYFDEDSYILREGEPLMMLIITQGSACCFKPNNGENSMGIDSDAEYIEKGDLYGKELLEWGFRSPSHKKWVPTSNKTIKTHSKVEAFALTAHDLKHLVPMHTQAAATAKGFAQAKSFPAHYGNERKFSQNGKSKTNCAIATQY